jgi:hypothetical protein
MSVLNNVLDILVTHFHYFEKATDLPFVEKIYEQGPIL